MLEHISIKGFKSLRDVSVDLPAFTVLFGPNAAGKSNFLDAIHFLSAAINQRTLQEALDDPVRGYPIEAFTFPSKGLPGLLSQPRAQFEIDSKIAAASGQGKPISLRYRLAVGVQPRSGNLTVDDEFLERLTNAGGPAGKARIEHRGEKVNVRKQKAGKPQEEPSGENHTVASIPAFAGDYFPEIDALKRETALWRTYYLDPRSAMREPRPPAEVIDIGSDGASLSAFLYRLKNTPGLEKYFSAISRMVRQVVPSVESLEVSLDEQRAQIDLWVRQSGISYSNRVISEGTLRVIALAALAINPWPPSLIAFEEPENGVHPRRLEHVANILSYAAGLDGNGPETGSQVIINTHSPLFVAEALKLKRLHPSRVAVLHVSHDGEGSQFTPIPDPGELFESKEIDDLLRDDTEARVQAFLLRGFLDG